MSRAWIAGASALLAVVIPALASSAEPLSFNRDVRPILSDTCFKCHGPDSAKRVTRLRLDDPATAVSDLGGYRAIAPGDPAGSELVRRLASPDPDVHMPPPESGLSLTPSQVETLRRWIAEGARYEKHWSLLAPREPELPAVRGQDWQRNPIDHFILARLDREGLAPSPEAPRETLIRRATLDLTGLPPTVEEVDAFLADESAGAYERVVDRLLASPRYGERMVLEWLDAARYADTNGYQGDNTRTLWIWRDWVIRALNDNLPFDRFTVEQLAGDLLPEATQDTRIATGFHRNHMLNGEGGRIPEESRVDYVMDRVETTGTVWLGLTIGCARCHDHKYDPIAQRDYYRLFAIFNNVPESGGVDAGGNANPILRLKTPEIEAQLAALERESADLEARIDAPAPAIDAAQGEWEKAWSEVKVTLAPWSSVGPFTAGDFDAAFAEEFAPEKGIDLTAAYPAAGAGELRWTPREEWEDGKVHPLTGSSAATYLFRTITAEGATSATLSLGSDDGLKVWLNGQLLLARKLVRAAAPDQEKLPVRLEAGENRLLLKVVNNSGGYGFYFRLRDAGPPKDVRKILAAPADGRSEADRARLRAHYRREVAPELKEAAAALATARARRAEIESSLPVTMVMEEMAKPRDAFILIRGAYDKPGEQVEPGVPAALPGLPEDAPRNRLGLARWLVSPENPLTARVLVNRYWAMFFGAGLVKTVEDFGSQGDPPSHPELLDWLAVRFARGWDVKALHRLLVTSATYRQSSRAAPELQERDPGNRLLARAPRFRLDAYALRDQALALGGLLVEKIGGPPVKPYQPPGIWEDFSFGQIAYVEDKGEDLYRRSLYTFWRRSVGPTTMFDTSSRQVCTVRQARTNTPLHALVLLNDVTYVEAARGLAARLLGRRGEDARARIAWAFRAATARQPSAAEVEVLARGLERALTAYRAAPDAAAALLWAGESPVDPALDPAELAAYTGTASVILNLDETITRE